MASSSPKTWYGWQFSRSVLPCVRILQWMTHSRPLACASYHSCASAALRGSIFFMWSVWFSAYMMPSPSLFF